MSSDFISAIAPIKLSSTSAIANGWFGYSCALSGNFLVIGAYQETTNSLTYAGAAYVFTWNGSSWGTIPQRLISSTPIANGNFGYSCAISGYNLVIGAWNETYNTKVGAGMAYTFIYDTGTSLWGSQSPLNSTSAIANGHFGCSCAISGSYLVIGAFNETFNNFICAGEAYSFTLSGSTWGSQTKLYSSLPISYGCFGCSCAMSGSYLVIGAFNENSGAGAAYVYTLSGSTWTSQTRLYSSSFMVNGFFGYSCAISPINLVIGAYNETTNGLIGAGAAYSYTLSGGTWGSQTRLTSSVPTAYQFFGSSCVISETGTYLVIGAYIDYTNGNTLLNIQGSANSYYISSYPINLSYPNVWYQFNDYTNLGVDFIGYNNLITSGAPTYTTTCISGKFSLSLNGSSALTSSIFNSSLINGQSFTISFWVYPTTATTSANAKTIICIGNSTSQLGIAYQSTNGIMKFQLNLSDSLSTSLGYNDINTWVHWSFTYNYLNKLQSIYRNGTFIVSGTASGYPNITTNDIYIGQWRDGSSFFTGYIDDFRIYSFCLTDSQILQIFKFYTITNNISNNYISTSTDFISAIAPINVVSTNPVAYGWFGYSCAVSGNYLIIGASGEHSTAGSTANYAGAAYLYTWNTTTSSWGTPTRLTANNYAASTAVANGLFGFSCAISSGNFIAISAIGENSTAGSTANKTGVVYTFKWTGSAWNTTPLRLTANNYAASTAVAGGLFGSSCAIYGNYLIVGASGENLTAGSTATSHGAAYPFYWNGSAWTITQRLTSSSPIANGQFGCSCSITSTNLVVGAYLETNTYNYAGAAYVFTLSESTWGSQTRLVSPYPTLGGNYGYSCAISGNYLVIGAFNETTNGLIGAGAAYGYSLSSSTWSAIPQRLTSSTPVAYQYFGTSCVMSESRNYLLIGSYLEYVNMNSKTGSAYAYYISSASIIPQISNGFGNACAISNKNIIVSNTGISKIYKFDGLSWGTTSTLGNDKVVIETTVNFTKVNNSYGYYTFTQSASFIVSNPGYFKILLVGGGGNNNGNNYSGGGGGGGISYYENFFIPVGTYNITVGQSEGTSSINLVGIQSATGGGTGGGGDWVSGIGGSGGTGNWGSGGAGGGGSGYYGGSGGNGNDGIAISITGTNVYYGGGGGGYGGTGNPWESPNGGKGGGGGPNVPYDPMYNRYFNGANGVDGLGGGASGGGGWYSTFRRGGYGVVIIGIAL